MLAPRPSQPQVVRWLRPPGYRKASSRNQSTVKPARHAVETRLPAHPEASQDEVPVRSNNVGVIEPIGAGALHHGALQPPEIPPANQPQAFPPHHQASPSKCL